MDRIIIISNSPDYRVVALCPFTKCRFRFRKGLSVFGGRGAVVIIEDGNNANTLPMSKDAFAQGRQAAMP
jgi:hypothetical protein